MVYHIRAAHVFLGTLLFALVLHSVYWKNLDDSPDQQNWIREMKQFQETSFESQRSSLYYGYPATTILLASYILPFAGIMAFGIAIPIALSTTLCFLLRPKSLWFIGVAGVLTTSQLYYNATPPSAIVTAFCTSLVLCALYIYEKKKDNTKTAIFFGGLAGVAMATRIDFPLVVLCFLCMFLLPTLKKEIVTVVCAAFIVFVLCNPYMVVFPLLHLGDIIQKITTHTGVDHASALQLRQVFYTVPLSIIGFFLSSVIFLFPSIFRNSIPRSFLGGVLGMSVFITTGLLVFSAYQPVWYFYPVLQIFEVFFTLFLLDALVYIKRSSFIWLVLAMLIFGNASIFFMRLFV